MDEKYMRRAIELAKKGAGKVSPNPLVGAVIVKEGRIIAEGCHKEYGDFMRKEMHFQNLVKVLAEVIMYVTLEHAVITENSLRAHLR